MLRHRRLLLSASLALGSALIAGCSSLPTQPVVESSQRSDTPTRSSAAVPAQSAVQSASTSKVIRGLLGGVVAAGDFKVVIPPLAISGTATVTVTQPDLSKLECDLQISPASANQFRLPVLLVANGSKLDLSLLKVSRISRYNPSTTKWEPVPGSSVNLLNLTVEAPLWHFSQYRVEGKIGW